MQTITEQAYYYIAIDKQEKTIQLRKYQENSCQAREIKLLANEYNMNTKYPAMIDARFTIFHNDTVDHIDYGTFYKKYAKYKVLMEVL